VSKATPAHTVHDRYRSMFRHLVQRMVLVSLLPLVAIGGINFYIFFRHNRAVVVEQHANFLRYHRESLSAFLNNLATEVATLAHQYSLAELEAGDLERAFQVIRQQEGVFTDVGIINSSGQHLMYIGPYDLAQRNYREADWFKQVVDQGLFISDMFLGFRAEPHFVIAVKRVEGNDFWILRATVNTDYFSKLVDAVSSGRTGETFIINSTGVFQTKTRFGGAILTPSGYPNLAFHDGIQVHEVNWNGRRYLCTATWLDNPRWLLIYRQEFADVYAPLWRASASGIALFLLGAIVATALAIVVARRQVRIVHKADREKEALTQELLVTGRTAAVGELSAGVAHEINNPLATIDTLQTWIRDLASESAVSAEDLIEILDSARKIGEQVERCKTITLGLLKFSRRVETSPEEIDLNEILEELSTMARARARVEGATIATELGDVPLILASPLYVQQIVVNLVNNALDAVAGRPQARVTIRSHRRNTAVCVDVIDNGCGIAPDNLSRIFTPFFTTKPVGQGTGLGLAICYGLVKKLGGTIQVNSTLGQGTTFSVVLPAVPPAPAAEGDV